MKHYTIKTLSTFFIAFTVFFSSCQKEDSVDTVDGGQARVTITMKGVGTSNGNKSNVGLRSSAGTSNKTSTPAIQRQVVQFNELYQVTATLREVNVGGKMALRASSGRSEGTGIVEGEILPLKAGTPYTIKAFKNGTEVKSQEFIQGDANPTFDLNGGSYTFVVYAYGNNEATGADKDPMWWTTDQTIIAGQSNNLNIVLEHKLSEVTVVFNAGARRSISAIGNSSTITPNHNFTFHEETGAVEFSTETNAAKIHFANQAAGQIWTSDPTMVAVEDTDNGVITLKDVVINDITGQVSIGGWKLQAGVQYILDFNLGDKEEEGIEVGGLEWAPGHLTYDRSTDSYSITPDNQVSDSYFFPNYVKPKVLGMLNGDDINRAPTTEQNGAHGDPCALLLPLNSWRLPTVQEINNLKARTDVGGADNPGPNRYAPARFGATYTEGGVAGMFFGTQSHPGEDRDKYLFIPYTGVYNNGPGKQETNFGYYLLRNGNGFGALQVTGMGISWTMNVEQQPRSSSTAYKVRCVKN